MNKYMNLREVGSSRRRQRGVVLLFSLIALVIMLIVAVALVRSFNNSLFGAGNIGFKRDLQNQSERAVELALKQFKPGGTLALPADRAASVPSSNYSDTMLATNPQGVPNVLTLSDSAFAALYTAPDISPANQAVKVRYVVDRLCAITGNEKTIGAATSCRLGDNPVPPGTSLSNWKSADRFLGAGGSGGSGGGAVVAQSVVYRLSIKVSGPRNTQSFFQSTFAVPTPP